MTREEAIKTAYENEAHPYSINAMTEMLLKGAEIGRMEAIDDACEWLNQNTDWGEKDRYEGEIEEVFRKAMEE